MSKILLLKRRSIRYLKVCFLMIFLWLGLKAQATENTFVSIRIDIKLNNSSFREFFEDIRRQTGFRFIYNNEEFNEEEMISVSASRESLKQVLDKALLGTKFTWDCKDRMIIIKPRNQFLNNRFKNDIFVDSIIEISGIIKDQKGNPIPGATISVKGNSRLGALSSADGHFIIRNVPQKSVLKVTCIGYLEQSFNAEGIKKTELITLVESVNILNGPVVEAYSVTTRKYSTSGISGITEKQIETKPITNALLALQGEVPGVLVQQASGFANAGISVQIRGINSLGTGSDPLYVVDGVPYTSQLMETVNPGILGSSANPVRPVGYAKEGNPLSFINPADIESISVLKDADATSIYGSRAAAGAILITTKKGKSGPNRLNVNFQQGWGKVAKFADLLNKDEYMKMRHQAKANSNQSILASDYDLNGTWDTTRSTDWQKVLLGGTSRYSDVQVSTSGGTENTKFLVGAGYHKETGVLPIDLINKKGSLHFNITSNSANQKFNLQLSGSYLLDNNIVPYSTTVNMSRTLSPVAPAIYNKDGSLNWQPNASGSSTWTNPLATSSKSTNKTNNLVSNLQVSYDIIPGLKIKSSFGFNNMQINEVLVLPSSGLRPERRASYVPSATYSNGSITSWMVEPLISYEKGSKNGKFGIFLGSTLQYNNNSQQMFRGVGYSSDLLLEDPRSAATIQYLSTTATTYRYNALFGRINYRFKDRYIINLSARRDGSSRFGAENLFHNFASLGTAWIFSEEKLFLSRLRFISFGKLQFSYGTTGNDQIGDYSYLSLYSSNSYANNYQGITGLYVNGLSNPYLQWEETKKMQFSLELGFVENRLFFNGTYFRNRSSNQLQSFQLPTMTGFSGYTRNFPATLQNMGWEMSLNAEIIKSQTISWSSRFNLYIPQNKLIAFKDLATSPYASSYKIGSPITEVKVYKFAGVNSETGLYQFWNSKGDVTSSPSSSSDRRPINLNPAYSGGFSNTLTFKGFQLDVLIQYNKQWVLSQRFGYSYPGGFSNQPKSAIDNQWSGIGDKNASTAKSLSIVNTSADISYTAASRSDLSFINSYLIRVKNVSLSWHLPNGLCKNMKIQNGQVFVHAQNLFTSTNFLGGDPEVNSSGALGPLRMITVGAQLTL